MEPRSLLPPPLLQVKDLRLLLPTPAGGWHNILAGVTLQVDPGEAVGLCGPSGGGKTQTGLALLGLWPRHARLSGSIRLQPVGELVGRDNLDWREIRGKRLAMVFQDPAAALNPLLSVGRHLAEVMRADGKPRKDWRRHGLDLLEMVAMPDPAFFERRYPHQLSGGQRQRLMIALALARAPSLLIADEPTTALDVTIQAQILDLLQRLRRELGLAVLLISHDRHVVARLCERIVWIQQGTTSTEASGREAANLVGAA